MAVSKSTRQARNRFFAVFVLSLLSVLAAGCSRGNQPICITVSNPTGLIRNDEGISIPLGKLPSSVRRNGMALRDSAGRDIPFQIDDLDGDGRPDELFFEVSLGPYESISCLCYPGEMSRHAFLKRADAHLLNQVVPGLQGAVWESEWLAYACFDAQSLNVYGKTNPALLGAKTIFMRGKVGTAPVASNYLRPGAGMGAGSVFLNCGPGSAGNERPFDNQAQTTYGLVASGPLRGIVDLSIKNWQTQAGNVELSERIEIDAGQRFLKVEFHAVHWPDNSIPLKFGAGITSLPGQERLQLFDNRLVLTSQGSVIVEDPAKPVSAFLASALIFRPRDFIESPPGVDTIGDHLVYLRKPDFPVLVYYLHAWDRDGRFTSAAEWQGYTAELAERMNNPLEYWVSH
ncbi:MAG: DUF4861 family protein [Methylacidiphilales bacterium]|nr:DUF4861 family protein [Candidatus Methylacidiphilales bacterium]